MSNYRKLQHSEWECKHHVIFIPKYRRKVPYGTLRQYLGEVFRRLARQKESEIEEGHLMADHVHMMIAIPPKYAVAQVVGYIKGKAPSTLPGTSGRDAGTSSGSTSGHEATSCPRWAGMRRSSGATSRGKRTRIGSRIS